MRMTTGSGLVFCIGVALWFAAPAQAALIAYEGFDGMTVSPASWSSSESTTPPTGVLSGQSGTGSSGWTGNWTDVFATSYTFGRNKVFVENPAQPLAFTGAGNSHATVNGSYGAARSSLSYSVTGGGTISGGNRYIDLGWVAPRDALFERQLSATVNADAVYFSVLAYLPSANNNFNGNFYAFWVGTTLTAYPGSNSPQFGMINPTSTDANFNCRINGSVTIGAGVPIAGYLDQTVLLVARLSKTVPGAGNSYNQMEMWIDPAYGAGSGAGQIVSTVSSTSIGSSFSTFGFRSGNNELQMQFDEIRIGTTWADVVPGVVPEPATLALLGLAGLTVIARRRRHGV